MTIDKELLNERGDDKKKKILTDLTLGRRTDLATLASNEERQINPFLFLSIMTALSPRSTTPQIKESDLKAIDKGKLSDWQTRLFKKEGYIDSKGRHTPVLIGAIFKQTPAFERPLNYKHKDLFHFVGKHREHWQEEVIARHGLVAFRHAIGLQKAGWFSTAGQLSKKAHGFLKAQEDADFKFLSSRMTSQQVSLLNLLTVYGDKLNETLYRKVTRSKVPWQKQIQTISWMKSKGLVDSNMNPTDLSVQIRLYKVPRLKDKELGERDCRIEEYLRLGKRDLDFSRLKLSDISAHELESRIFRMRASGFINDNGVPISDFSEKIDKLRTQYAKSIDPPWLTDKRSPKLDEVTNEQRNTLVTLATESPYLTETQILEHLSIDPIQLKQLSRGQLLKTRIEIIGDTRVRCYALNNEKANALLKQAGVEKPLRGKFQKASHMRHDFMLFESLQEFKRNQYLKGDPVVQILHERAIYQMKTSPNDNKGITTPDLVVRTASGEEIALEYGNYKPQDMIRKVTNFAQMNVVVFTSDANLLTQYVELASSIPIQKIISWNYLPEVPL